MLRLAESEYAEEGLDTAAMQTRFSIDLRYTGQSYTLNVPWTGWQESLERFHELHRRRYGYALDAPTEAVNVRLRAWFSRPGFDLPAVAGGRQSRNQHAAGESITGPATVPEYASTTYVAAGWRLWRDGLGNLFAERDGTCQPNPQ